MYIKKGASIIDQYMEEDFCVLLLFVEDRFVGECVREVAGQLKTHPPFPEDDQRALTLRTDVTLSSYFQSMLSYFSEKNQPSESLLILKLKELILSILLTGKNPELASYFQSMAGSGPPGIRQVMETNFPFNLSLSEYAELCNRSLSTFKRDFRTTYGEPPGRWLTAKRLEYAAILLQNAELQVTQIALQSGFEDLSHFSRSFKAKFGTSPAQFRKRTGQNG